MKKLIAMLLALAVLFSLAGCGSSNKYSSDTSYSPAAAGESYDDGYFYESSPAETTVSYDPGALTANKKLIYRAHVSAETKDFDTAKAQVDGLVVQFGGYLESSDVSGSSYSDSRTNRRLDYTIRIPAETLDDFLAALGECVNITSNSKDMKNVTDSYVDTQARLDTLEQEEDRLLDLLKKAEDLEAVLQIEDRLTDVRYQIESMTAILRSYDSEIAYSTVDLYLRDVTEYTVSTSFGSRFSDAFTEGWSSFGRFLENFLLFLVRALPFLLLIAVIVAVILLLVKRFGRKRKGKFPVVPIAVPGAPQPSSQPVPGDPDDLPKL